MAALRQRSETRNVGTKWEADDNRKFIAMAKSGASEAEMASTFLRTENGIREHLKLLVRQGALSESTLPLSQPTATPPLSRASSASQLGSQHSLSQPTTPARANKRWGANEERTLKQYLSTSTLQCTAENMQRTEGAIIARLEKMGICETLAQFISRVFGGESKSRYTSLDVPVKSWSCDEESQLREMLSQKKTLYEITSQLGRTGESVICKMEKLNLCESRFDFAKRKTMSGGKPTVCEVGVKREREEPANDAAETCDICMDGKKDCAFVPCGHRACRNCASSLVKCHLCRKDIAQRLRLF